VKVKFKDIQQETWPTN